MQRLVELVKNLSKDKQLVLTIDQKISSFKNLQKKSSRLLFQELCFCILTANYSAKKAIYIQENIKDGFNNLSETKIAKELKKLGHRFPNTRAKYICYSRKYQDILKKTLFSFNTSNEKRDWLVKNIKGLGYKEASHFLRNIGVLDVAIIDFHIVDVLVSYKLIKKPKTMTKKEYLSIEKKLKQLAKKTNKTLGELDLYLWFYETKTVFK